MQSISPLTLADFKNKSNIVIGKAEIDSDGAGTYVALPDVIDFSITTNIENQVGRLCSYSFSITVLNTNDQFYPYNTTSAYYGYLKQGRRIKLYAGIKVSGTEYYYQWLIGRIDDYNLSKQAGNNICVITGRDFMRVITDYKLYSPNTYWGTTQTFNTVAGTVRYNMNAACKGAYIAYLDSTSPYGGSSLEPIYENTDWSYDWHNNQFCFLEQRIPDFAGTNNLVIYYMTTQTVENVVGHILYLAGIFVTTTARDAWIANASYVTPTAKTIDRVWFNTGTSALEAIRLLAEVVQYRLYFDYAGNPVFKPKASIGIAVENLYESDIDVKNTEENNEETYTHIIVTGEERDRVPGDDETAPAVPTGLALTTGMGSATQASLSWIKATWNANTEIDFGHYELRYKKNADSDYTEVSTIALSYIIYGLEPGVTYNVQVKACDIYENRSAWSTAVNQATATDATTPAQIIGQVATAIMAGIKVQWTAGSENNLAGYIIERQESPDNIDWTGAWVEKTRTDANLWLDLLLTYSKYYKYRITAYTQTGINGTTSAATTAVQPNKAGTNDIAAGAITANEIATNTITANKYNELRNTYVFNGDDSLDASFPFELDFEIVSEMTAINSVKLSFRISQFRAYATAAASGGGATPTSSSVSTPSGGGSTTSASGLTAINVCPAVSGELIAHDSGYLVKGNAYGVQIYDHTHPTPNHTHPAHTHIVTIAAHTHGITYGIYEDSQTPAINIFVDNGAGYGNNILTNTTVDADSAAAQTVLNVTSTTGYTIGDTVRIGRGTARDEKKIISTIQTGVSLTMTANLTYAHTAVQADTVEECYTTEQLDIAITGSISGSGFKKIKFEADTRCRIRAWVMCKLDISA